MNRPHLQSISLALVLPLGPKKGIVITMAAGQWDATLAAAYRNGWTLLELDTEEKPSRAYRKSSDEVKRK